MCQWRTQITRLNVCPGNQAGGLDRSKVPVLMSVFGDVSSVPGASPRQLNKLPTGARLILG